VNPLPISDRDTLRDTDRHADRQASRISGDGADADDDTLMAAYARSGDASAFERLYARHRSSLYRFVRRLLGSGTSAALVEEVYQDTWLRVVHARTRWQPQGATFRTWLFTMAHHRAVDVMRRGGREVSLDDSRDDDGGAPFEPAGTPWSAWPDALGTGDVGASGASHDDALFWRRAGVKLLECLGQLPLAQRAVFLLHHEDGETLDAIARTLDVGFETAKSRLRYAMSKLRVCMGAYLEPMQSLGSASAVREPLEGPG
jgi:RNA polymerase sigma factor (sigma-70 family)